MIYTAITGGYDSVKMQPPGVAQPILFNETSIHYWNPDPCRIAKFQKILGYSQLGPMSLWVDGSIVFDPCTDLGALAEEHLKDADIAVMKHPDRDCVYQEAKACIERDKDDPDTIVAQTVRYSQDGYPSNYLLSETGVMFRRNTPRVLRFCSMWWDEVTRGSRRDQISFPYVAWKLKMPYKQIEKRFYTVHPHGST
jgi:Protein of unknown function (DUF616)